MPTPLLEATGLKKYFPIKGGIFSRRVAQLHAVDDVTFSVEAGQTLGLVGESGCGKTTLGRCLLMLIRPTAGEIRYSGEELTKLSGSGLKRMRTKMAMIFQDPYSSLNPRMTVADIVGEPLEVQGIATGREKERRVTALMERVGLSSQDIYRYPHEFSGGQKQRIGIARALAVNPKFIVADEPVAALDVSTRAGILNLMRSLQRDLGLTYLLISHDLSVIKHMSETVIVMYLGRLVELSEGDELFSKPYHPYTRGLISSIPIPDPTAKKERILLPGGVSTAIDPGPGCRFGSRCSYRQEKCGNLEPKLVEVGKRHLVACHRFE